MLRRNCKGILIGGIIILSSFIHGICSEVNSKYYVGIGFSANRVASINYSKYIANNFNTWGNTHSVGINGSYCLNAGSRISQINVGIYRTQLANSFNISRYHPTFREAESFTNRNIPSIYWKSLQYYVSCSYKPSPSRPYSLNFGISVFDRQLNIGNFPSQVFRGKNDQKQKPIDVNGELMQLYYSYSLISVSEFGWAFNLGLMHELAIMNRHRLLTEISLISGLNPMVSSKVNYYIEDSSGAKSIGEKNAISTNTGFLIRVIFQYGWKGRV